MQTKDLRCKVITPLFSYGGDPRNAELRASSLKGLLRYTFRIIQQYMECSGQTIGYNRDADSAALFKCESELFGDAQSIPSPLRLAIIPAGNVKYGKQRLVLHKKNSYMNYITTGSEFTIRVRLQDWGEEQKEQNGIKAIDWYVSLIEISLLLGGIGRRSRKGRGCVSIVSQRQSPEQVKATLLRHLNAVLISKEHKYKFDSHNPQSMIVSDILKEKALHPVMRPVIEKIIFGEIIDKAKMKDYLRNVDQACHEIKKYKIKSGRYFATGNDEGGRFASSIMVSLAETTQGLLPIYTCVKPVVKGVKLNAGQEWEAFLQKIEQGGTSH